MRDKKTILTAILAVVFAVVAAMPVMAGGAVDLDTAIQKAANVIIDDASGAQVRVALWKFWSVSPDINQYVMSELERLLKEKDNIQLVSREEIEKAVSQLPEFKPTRFNDLSKQDVHLMALSSALNAKYVAVGEIESSGTFAGNFLFNVSNIFAKVEYADGSHAIRDFRYQLDKDKLAQKTKAIKSGQAAQESGAAPEEIAEAEAAARSQAAAEKPLFKPSFDIIATGSWYPPNFLDMSQRERKGMFFTEESNNLKNKLGAEVLNYDNYNMGFSMGLKLFKDISAYIDFGIGNEDVENAINLMAKLAAKWLTIQLDYHFVNGHVKYWDGVPYGDDPSGDPTYSKDFNQTWMTVALMLDLERLTNGTLPRGIYAGLFYTSAAAPFLIASEVEEYTNKNGDKRFKPVLGTSVFLIPELPLYVIGFRAGIGVDHDTVGVQGLFNLNFHAMLDIGGGKCDPDKEAKNIINKAKAANKNETDAAILKFDDDLSTFGVRFYADLGVDFIVGTFLAGLGLQLNTQYLDVHSENFFQSDLGFDFGPYLRIGLKL